MYYKNCNSFRKSDPIHPILLILHKLATCTSNTLSLHADFNPKLWLSTKVPPLAHPSVSVWSLSALPSNQTIAVYAQYPYICHPLQQASKHWQKIVFAYWQFKHHATRTLLPFSKPPPKLACSVTISKLFFHSCGLCHCQLPITQSNCIPFMRLTLGNLSVCGCELACAGVCIMHFTVVSIFIRSSVLILYWCHTTKGDRILEKLNLNQLKKLYSSSLLRLVCVTFFSAHTLHCATSYA